ncbi:MAG: TIGR00730 family Rossman fold protein [Dehalococcoidia bacterium]
MNAEGMLDYLDSSLFDADVEPDTAIQELSERDSNWLERVEDEFAAGFRLMEGRGPCVAVFGSARVRSESPLYQHGRAIGRELARQGFTVVTGGGPGLMEAANRGALEAGGVSIGLGITLNELEPPNRYTTAAIAFRYFFVRKVMLVKYATAFVMLPGGVGTLDELFETLNLIQTKKIVPFPVIMAGSDHWHGLVDWMRSSLYETRMVNPETMNLFLLEDDPGEVARTIRHWSDTHDVAALEQALAMRQPPRRISA